MTMNVTQWVEYLGFKPELLFRRISKGWTVEETLSIPTGERRKNRF